MEDIYSILGKIKTENRRLTKTRIGILKAFFQLEKPLETRQIRKWLSKNRIKVDRTTIYRQLRYLTAKKFLNKFQLEGGKKYYELAQEHHHHLVCVRCKEIRNIAIADCLAGFEKELAAQKNFKILGHTFEFYGLCSKCADKTWPDASPAHEAL